MIVAQLAQHDLAAQRQAKCPVCRGPVLPPPQFQVAPARPHQPSQQLPVLPDQAQGDVLRQQRVQRRRRYAHSLPNQHDLADIGQGHTQQRLILTYDEQMAIFFLDTRTRLDHIYRAHGPPLQ